MFVTIFLQSGLTDFNENLYIHLVDQRIGFYLFFIPLKAIV
jgi:hypothetical protein